MTIRKHVNAIFNRSENVSQFLTDGTTFYNVLSTAPANTYVSITAASMTAALGRIATARAAEAAVGTGTIGLAAARDLAVSAVVADVRNYQLLVQAAANNALDVATAVTIVTECGLVTKRTGSRTKPDFAVSFDTTTAGLLDLVFKAAAHGVKASYEVQQSLDNVNWLTIKVSPDCSTTYAHGFTLGTKLYFRGRIILSEKKGGAQAWLTPSTPCILTL